MFARSNHRPLAALAVLALAAPSSGQDYVRQVLPSDAGTGVNFGHSVAISGSTILVGAPNDDEMADNAGAAYLIDAATGTELHKLTRQSGAAVDRFGWSVALSGDRAVVGSYQNSRGLATLYDASTGQEIMDLDPGQVISPQDFYSWDVAISDQVIVVGARGDDDAGSGAGAVYLFDPVTGQLRVKVSSPTPQPIAQFGRSVAADGQYVFVGAPLESITANTSGAVYVFDAVTGAFVDRFVPDAVENAGRFGYDLAVSGNRLAVCAPKQLSSSAPASFVLVLDLPSGDTVQRLDQVGLNTAFANSVGISSDRVVVGAYESPHYFTNDGGKAFLFSSASGERIADLGIPSLMQGDQLGWSTAITDEYTVVGAWKDNNSGFSDSGCIYIYATNNAAVDFCSPAVPNTSGAPAMTTVFGSPQIQLQDMQLVASFLPPSGVFAFFLASRTTGFLPGAGGSQGNLCLGGSIARLNRPGEVGLSVAGNWTVDMPFADIPEPGTGGVPILSGETWHFQCWFRDDVPGVGMTSNYSNATSVLFQ